VFLKQSRVKRGQEFKHQLEVTRQFLVLEALTVLVNDADYEVVAMQINACKQ
jgi:hypothetical protein